MCRFWWALTRISDFDKARARKRVGREREVTDTLKLTVASGECMTWSTVAVLVRELRLEPKEKGNSAPAFTTCAS